VDLKSVMTGAVKDFIRDVKERKFPTEEHSFK
jgi:ketopantoate hydroxymethyltransferase